MRGIYFSLDFIRCYKKEENVGGEGDSPRRWRALTVIALTAGLFPLSVSPCWVALTPRPAGQLWIPLPLTEPGVRREEEEEEEEERSLINRS